MTARSPYTKVVLHAFEVAGQQWAITEVADDALSFEETRKNGQEDTHMFGEMERIDGRWKLDEDSREQIDQYANVGAADALEAFFNKHGGPPS